MMFVWQCNPKHSHNPSWAPFHLNWSRSPFLSSIEGQNEQKQIKKATNKKIETTMSSVICHKCVIGDIYYRRQWFWVVFWWPNSISLGASFRFSQDQCRQYHHTKHPLEFLNDRRCYQAPWKLLWPRQQQTPRLICTACSIVGGVLEVV